MNAKVTPIILAGGRSSRMGTNKSFILFQNKVMIEGIIEKLKNIFAVQPMIVTNEKALYQYLNLQLTADVYKGRGPMAGIHAGLMASATEWNFFCACDMPFLSEGLIMAMLDNIKAGFDAVVPYHDGKYEPLCALYNKSCLTVIDKELQQEALKLQCILPKLKLNLLKREEIIRFSPKLECFYNVNTVLDVL